MDGVGLHEVSSGMVLGGLKGVDEQDGAMVQCEQVGCCAVGCGAVGCDGHGI